MDNRTQIDLAAIRSTDYPVSLTVKTYESILRDEIADAVAKKAFWPTPDYFTEANYDKQLELQYSLKSIASDRQFKVFNWLNANRFDRTIPYFGNEEQTAERIYLLMDDYGRAIWSAGEDKANQERLIKQFLSRLRKDLTEWGTWRTIKTDIMASVEDAHGAVHDEWNKVVKAKA